MDIYLCKLPFPYRLILKAHKATSTDLDCCFNTCHTFRWWQLFHHFLVIWSTAEYRAEYHMQSV